MSEVVDIRLPPGKHERSHSHRHVLYPLPAFTVAWLGTLEERRDRSRDLHGRGYHARLRSVVATDPQGDTDAFNYNFGERPAAEGPIQPGQTAGIGFWQNKHGQSLIQALHGAAASTQLGDWLAATLPNMFAHLGGKSNTEVGTHFRTLFAIRGQKLEAQVMATALAVYVTNQSLAGTVGQAYGFHVSTYGVGTRTYNVGSRGAAFGVEDDTELTVLDLLLATDAMTLDGVLYYADNLSLTRALRSMANEVYSDINQ